MADRTSRKSESFDACLSGLRQRNEGAAAAVWQRFAPKLRRRVGSRLTAQSRVVLDADDVLQSAFRSFFYRFREDRFQLKNWFALWQLLVTITDRKCNRQNRRFAAAKRTANIAAGPDERSDGCALNSNGPSDDVILAETLERLFQTRDARDRDILWMYMHGVPVPEISREARLSQRSVERCILRARQWLERQSLA